MADPVVLKRELDINQLAHAMTEREKLRVRGLIKQGEKISRKYRKLEVEVQKEFVEVVKKSIREYFTNTVPILPNLEQVHGELTVKALSFIPFMSYCSAYVSSETVPLWYESNVCVTPITLSKKFLNKKDTAVILSYEDHFRDKETKYKTVTFLPFDVSLIKDIVEDYSKKIKDIEASEKKELKESKINLDDLYNKNTEWHNEEGYYKKFYNTTLSKLIVKLAGECGDLLELISPNTSNKALLAFNEDEGEDDTDETEED